MKISGPLPPLAQDKDSSIKTSVAFLVNDVRDIYESFVLRILSTLLLDGPSSLFYRALIESDLGASHRTIIFFVFDCNLMPPCLSCHAGSDLSPNTGYDGHGREASLAVGVQDASTEDIEKIHSTIAQVFQEAASKPFDMEQIESVLHQIELSQKYQSTRFGLGLASSLFPAWIHNGKLNALHDLFIHSSTLQPILLR